VRPQKGKGNKHTCRDHAQIVSRPADAFDHGGVPYQHAQFFQRVVRVKDNIGNVDCGELVAAMREADFFAAFNREFVELPQVVDEHIEIAQLFCLICLADLFAVFDRDFLELPQVVDEHMEIAELFQNRDSGLGSGEKRAGARWKSAAA